MQIDRDTPICGLKPSELKAVLRREYFSTIEAMKAWAMNEPGASVTLRELAAEGWISFDGVRGNAESWKTTEQGNRLAVTKLIKRFPVAEGRAALERIIEKARELNGDASSSRRISAVTLFGSVLTAAADADAGDIDLVVSIRRRKIPKEEIAILEAFEKERMPNGRWSMWNNQRERELLRAIKKVSHRIALHSASDLEVLRPAHQEIYRYDTATERELPAGSTIAAGEPIREADAQTESENTIPDLPVRSWPHAPNAPAKADHTDLEVLLECQHSWIRGESAKEIAQRARFSERACEAYLSGLTGVADRLPDRLFPSFRTSVHAAGLPWMASAVIERWPGQSPLADVTIFEEGTFETLAWVRRVARYDANFRGESQRFASLDAASFVAWQYAHKLAASSPKLGFRISTMFLDRGIDLDASEGALPKLDPFVAPMLDVLREQRRRAGKNWDAYRERIVVEFDSGGPIQRMTRGKDGWPHQGKRILKRDAHDLWQMVSDTKTRYPFIAGHQERYTLFVFDRHDE